MRQVCAVAAVLMACLLGGCTTDEEREDAEFGAGVYCSQLGYEEHTDEFENCVEDNIDRFLD